MDYDIGSNMDVVDDDNPSIDVVSLLDGKEDDSKTQNIQPRRNQKTYTNSNKFRPKFNPPRGLIFSTRYFLFQFKI